MTIPKHDDILRIVCPCCGSERSIKFHGRNPPAMCASCFGRTKDRAWLRMHGESKTKLYNVHSAMKARCYRKTDPAYVDYGGRGITMCAEWRADYRQFAEWARANGYQEGLTIDRIDNDRSYYPENCRWVTQKVQASNKRPIPGHMTKEEAREIKAALERGVDRSEIRAAHGISRRKLWKITSGETFKDVHP